MYYYDLGYHFTEHVQSHESYRTALDALSNNPETIVTMAENPKGIFSLTKPREIVAWILVIILSIILLVSSVIHVMQAVCFWAYRRRLMLRNLNTSLDCTVATDNNPCYEAVSSKLNEAQEAVHVYENVKEMKLKKAISA